MSFETATKAIELCDDGQNTGIIFFGGEPLLKKELIWNVIEWCEKQKNTPFHYKVTTNGLLLDEEFLDKADKHRLHIALSHDGIKEAHDATRIHPDGRGSFDEVTDKLRLLLKKRPYSPVMLTVNPETISAFHDSVQWLQEEGVQYLICSVNYAGEWNDKRLKLLKKEYLKLEKWHFNNYRAERKMYFSPFDKRMATHIFEDRENSCRLGKRQMSIGPDGQIYPCVQFVGRDGYAIGNTSDGIDHEKREDIFCRNEADKPICIDCALNRRCHNKCGCLNIQTTGNLETTPPVLCEHERMIFPIVDRLAENLYKQRNPMFIQRHYNRAFPILSFLEDLSL